MTAYSDPIPTHGIIFRISGIMKVSCLCRANPLKHSRTRGGGEYYEPMQVDTYESVYDAYNRPENHFAPFTIGDKINGNAHR